MQITLTPMRRDDALTLHRAGDVLTINGVAYDFGPLPEGALLCRAAVGCDWLASDVGRVGGKSPLPSSCRMVPRRRMPGCTPCRCT